MTEFIFAVIGYAVYIVIILGGIAIAIWMISTLFHSYKKTDNKSVNIVVNITVKDPEEDIDHKQKPNKAV
ncbi:MAG: hypothetical protein RR293_08535 [Bacteroidales bacterium]